jgi:RNA polymerase sigma-70 factor (ECF subfamily)
MEPVSMSDPQATQLVQKLESGDPAAAEDLVPLVYTELRGLAAAFLRREGRGHTLQPTAMVHEAFMRLVDQTRVEWKGRAHFIAVAAQAMRRILVDHARAKKAAKRGGDRMRVTLQSDLAISPERDEDVLALNEALEKLQTVDERQARIVELRFFGGLTVREVAEVLDVSTRTVENDWTMVRAWLRRELSVGEADG